jgi:hypothetical protein
MEVAALAMDIVNSVLQVLLDVVDPSDFVDVHELSFELRASLSDFGNTGFYWHTRMHLFRILGGPILETEMIFDMNDLLKTAASIAETGFDIVKKLLGFRRRRRRDAGLEPAMNGTSWVSRTGYERYGVGLDWGSLNASHVARDRRAVDYMSTLSDEELKKHNELVEEATARLVVKTLDPSPEKRAEAEAWWAATFQAPGRAAGPQPDPQHEDESLDN